MNTKHKTISNREGQFLYQLDSNGVSWFRTDDAYSYMPELTKGGVRSLIKRMNDKGLVTNLSGDLYWVVPLNRDPEEYLPDWHLIASSLMSGADYYIGYYSALQVHGLITQPSLREQIVTRTQMQSKELKGVEFQFIAHNAQHFFGAKNTWIDSHNRVLCSDLEKTFVDCLFKPDYSGGVVEIAKALWMSRNKIDYSKLLKYCNQFGSKTVSKRLGYLLETLDIGNEITPELKGMKNNAISLLDTSSADEGRISSRWALKINVDTETIFNAIDN